MNALYDKSLTIFEGFLNDKSLENLRQVLIGMPVETQYYNIARETRNFEVEMTGCAQISFLFVFFFSCEQR